MEDKTDIFGDGRAIIFRNIVRGKINPVWQCYITTASSKGRIRKSTGTRDKKQAERIATDELFKAEGRLQQGLPLNPIRFEDAAREYLHNLRQQQLLNRTTENNYNNQKRVIRGAIVPHFGTKFLHQIKEPDIERYHLTRKSIGLKQGQPVKGGTLNRDNSYLRGIFNHAKKLGYISSIPLIENFGSGEQRPSFTYPEMLELREALDDWVASVHPHDAPHILDYRRLFRLYINIIQYSGIRPGVEMASLAWKDVEYKSQDGQEYVKLITTTSKQKNPEQQGKTRVVIAMKQLQPHLEEIKRHKNCYDESGFIFAHPPTTQLPSKFIGKPIKSFKAQWKSFSYFAGIASEEEEETKETKTLYSIRHYYMEQRLINSDVSLVALADNTGTSPDVILRWYREAASESFASSLSKVIEREQS